MIKDIDISVVVQGPVIDKVTDRCLQRIKELLPRSELIFSTCSPREQVGSLLYDVLVINDDPGAALRKWHRRPIFNNINRQIISTKGGLKKVSRPYCLKLRSDLFVENLNFIQYFENLVDGNIEEKYKVFSNKVLASVLFTKVAVIKKDRIIPIPFHVSDWWFFGLSSDVCNYLGNTPLVDEPEFTNHFNHYVELNPFGTYEKFTSEQYIFISFFKRKYPEINIENSSVVNANVIELSNKLIEKNFEILNFDTSGIFSLKYKNLKNERVLGDLFLCLYPFHSEDITKEKIIDYKLIKHKNRFKHSTKLIKIAEELICIIVLYIKLLFLKIKI